MTQNIGIIDADLLHSKTSFPNLALMKISGYHKSLNTISSAIMYASSQLPAATSTSAIICTL